VQAAGSNANSARLAAIFVRRQGITPQTFMATGPVTNAAIDAEVARPHRANRKSKCQTAGIGLIFVDP